MRYQVIPRSKIKVTGYRLRFKSGREDIDDLATSIERNGLICPLAVSRQGNNFSLVAGERRLSACEKLGMKEIPCVILDEGGKAEALIKGIVENIERLDLSPLERAKGFEEAIAVYGETEEEIAGKIGRSQSYVSHHLRLLKRLHPAILQYLHKAELTFGHAQTLMTLDDREKQLEIAEKVVKDDLTVQDTWVLVDLARPTKDLTDREKALNEIERDIIKEFKKEWRRKINIKQGKKEETVTIRFASRGELLGLAKRIIKALG